MADEHNDYFPDAPVLNSVPVQMIPAGQNVEIDFSVYAKRPAGKVFEFSIHDFPPGFTIDSTTGVVTGFAPKVELNKSFSVSLVLTDLNTEKYSQCIFRLEVIGTLILETEEGQALFKKVTEDVMSQPMRSWEIQLFLQQLINEHYVWIMIYDAKQHLVGALGELLERREAKTGWTIINYENAVVITPGDKAFEEYGNRTRVLNTLREAYEHDVAPKKWEQIRLDGSDIENLGKAWVIAKEMEIPTEEEAPSEVAEVNLYNLNRVYSGKTPSKKYRLQPGI